MAGARAHVVCLTDAAVVSVDVEAWQPRHSQALESRPGALAVSAGACVVAAARDASVVGFAPGRPVALRTRVPEALAAAAVSTDGAWLAAGGRGGRLYVWELWSGRLARAWDAHFRSATALAWDERDDVLVSGGDDAIAHCWDATALVAGGGAAPAPRHTWAEHAMPVRAALARGGRAWTVAADRTACARDVASGASLVRVALAANPTCVCLDACDAWLVAGCEDGTLRRVDLDAAAIAETARGAFVAGDGGGGGGGGGGAYERHDARVTGVAQPPGFGAAALVSAAEDGAPAPARARAEVRGAREARQRREGSA